MKFLAVFFFLSTTVFAQTTAPVQPKAEAAKQPTLTAQQTADIRSLIKDYQILQLQQQLAKLQQDAALSTAVTAINDAVAAAKKQLGLDDSWEFNFQTLQFVKKAVPPAAPDKK